jgi:hypothetical protein
MLPIEEKPQWLRIKGEPILAYRRFTSYRNLGVTRSFRKAFLLDMEAKGKAHKYDHSGVPGSWLTLAARWNWKERAEAWDQSIIDEEELDARSDARKKRAERSDRREAAITKTLEMIEALDPAIHEVRAGDLVKGLVLLNQDERADYEERFAKEDKLRSGQKLTDGITDIAALVRLAMTRRPPEKLGDPMANVILEESPVFDAEFSEIEKPEKKPEILEEILGE